MRDIPLLPRPFPSSLLFLSSFIPSMSLSLLTMRTHGPVGAAGEIRLSIDPFFALQKHRMACLAHTGRRSQTRAEVAGDLGKGLNVLLCFSGGIGQVVEGEGSPYLTGEELRILDAKWRCEQAVSAV